MFVFTGILWRDNDEYSALCSELDVPSQGKTVEEAWNNLLEAATLHIEGSFEEGLSYSRPVPTSEDPRNSLPSESLEIFKFKVRNDRQFNPQK